jgi:hypothetical protein
VLLDLVFGGGLTGGTGLIPWPIAAAHVRDLWRKGGDLSRSLCMKTSEQKSLSPRTKPAAHYCKPPPQENQKGATGESFRPYSKSLGDYRRIGYGVKVWSAWLLVYGGILAACFAV